MPSTRIHKSRYPRKYRGKSLPTFSAIYAGVKGSLALDTDGLNPIAYSAKHAGLGERLRTDTVARHAIEGELRRGWHLPHAGLPLMWVWF